VAHPTQLTYGLTPRRRLWPLAVFVVLALLPLSALPAGAQDDRGQTPKDGWGEGLDDRRDGDSDGLVLREDFDDESEGQLVAPSVPGMTDVVSFDYDGGEYVISWLPEDQWGAAQVAFLPFANEPVADVAVAADVRLVGETVGRSVTLGCREGYASDGVSSVAYRLLVEPDARRVALLRIDGDETVVLAEERRVRDVVRGEGINRIEMSCVGETIGASVNGEVVLTAEDDTYAEGAVSLGIDVAEDTPGPAEARWDNLEVRQVE
jgi:hypothetical protein